MHQTLHSHLSPQNDLRIIKLGSIKTVSHLKLRTVPISILQRLGLVDQVCPVSNFFFKVKLAANITDTILQSTLESFNKSVGDNLFHSFTNVSEDFDLNPSVRKIKASRSFFVVDCPPFAITDTDVFNFFISLQASGVTVGWGTGPPGTCLVVECEGADFAAPCTFVFNHNTYLIKHYTKQLPSSYVLEEGKSNEPNSLVSCFSSSVAGLAFPEHLESAILACG